MITTNCPIPFSDSDCVLLAHGSGGRMTHQLISSIFYPAFRNPLLEQDHGGCVIGVVPKGVHIAPDKAQPGDMVICSGPIGVHGITILSARESLGFETDLKSDTTSLNNMIGGLLKEIEEVHVLRDPTRGGVSGTLNEIAQAAGVEIVLDEALLPIPDAVRSASEILGLDPLYIANEGLVLVILPEEKVEQALAIMRNYPEGKNAAVIGCIQERDHTLVKMKTLYGNYRIVDMLSGEQLPRIC